MKYEIRQLNVIKFYVHQKDVGAVFIGKYEDCETYVYHHSWRTMTRAAGA